MYTYIRYNLIASISQCDGAWDSRRFPNKAVRSLKDNAKVARNSRSRIWITVVNLCALVDFGQFVKPYVQKCKYLSVGDRRTSVGRNSGASQVSSKGEPDLKADDNGNAILQSFQTIPK